MEAGERAAEDGARRILANQVADRRLDLLERSAKVAERVLVNPVDRHCHLRLGALSESECLGAELRALGQPAPARASMP